ncbi:MAG: hypothetical protein SOZ89_06235 [Peptoniphilaceae bacterium]|nr:hypothetical protein [Peptoniphilaceae bacterium]MDD7383532.1 hypothetical protein [Peptoniphilaceae bacterium]MDY3738705.1 hypothetical protein [Peptoniphilaceae bacterium]
MKKNYAYEFLIVAVTFVISGIFTKNYGLIIMSLMFVLISFGQNRKNNQN